MIEGVNGAAVAIAQIEDIASNADATAITGAVLTAAGVGVR